MKKMPTIFVRDWDGTLGPPGRLVLDEPHPDCGWVFAGEGAATRKLDGTCVASIGGALWKRHEVRFDKKRGRLRPTPEGFVPIDVDLETGATVGWLPVGDGPDDRWHRDAWERGLLPGADWVYPDGTYELVGPHVNGNPEGYSVDILVCHADLGDLIEDDPPRDHDGLAEWLASHDVEGVVWHHPDGRMAKIKGRDFGISR